MYVFRDGRKNVRGSELKNQLARWLESLGRDSQEDTSLGALIAAGELECALADAGFPENGAKSITNDLARGLLGTLEICPTTLIDRLAKIECPDTASVAVAEGFAYYALHPFRLEAPVRYLAAGVPVRIIGLRSIGTTLSAVVQALFTKYGCMAERITVRPTGHPYDRKLELSGFERNWLQAEDGALAVIVDEGPGLSGSSFLSVAEAVERAGVPPSRIVMLGSRVSDVSQMRAPNAAERWSRFRFVAASPAPVLPPDAAIDLTSGSWRHHFWEDFDHQAAAWTQLEPAKYMTFDRHALYKFHGYGHFAKSVAKRASAAAEVGFAPELLNVIRGFGKYKIESGRLLAGESPAPEIIERAAEYCAFRAVSMRTTEADASELETMARWNWQCEFGTEPYAIRLRLERPVIADGRMLPHEWMRTNDGRILKLDGSTHGDDHFFPGPCDIAWDLAGMIIEWEMNAAQSQAFLSSYQQRSGDDAGPRIADYLVAYAVFRMAWSKMAARASAGTFDEKLLLRDYVRYRLQVLELARSVAPETACERQSAHGLESAAAF